jgi:hypothetical protein
MKNYFLERGFKKVEVEKTIEVSKMPRIDTLAPKKKESNGRVPFVLTYHPRLQQLGKVLEKHFHLLQ